MDKMDTNQHDPLVAASSNYVQKLHWVAIYNNGEIVAQNNDEGFNSSEIIDHTRLYLFHLINDDDEPVYTLRLKHGQRFFYRARTVMRAAVGVLDRIHIVGWRDSNDARCVSFISEADSHVEVGDFATANDPYGKLRPWAYEIDWRDIDDVPIAETIVQIEDTEQVYQYIQK